MANRVITVSENSPSAIAKAVDEVINGVKDAIHKGVKETVADLYTAAIGRTPLAMGEAASNWEFGFTSSKGASQGVSKITSMHPGPYGPLTDVRDTGEAPSYRSVLRTRLQDHNTASDTTYILQNNTNYIMLLENGGYDNVPTHEVDPYPPKYPQNLYPRPFVLLLGGRNISKKAPEGMVKVTMLSAQKVLFGNVRKFAGGN